MLLYTPKSVTGDGIIPAIKNVGGKGSGLYWLQAHHFPTPPTWVLSTAAFDLMLTHIKMTTILQEIDQATASLPTWEETQRTLDQLEQPRQAIIKALRVMALPREILSILLQLPRQNQWAVRSSATVEDSEAHSFAGLFFSRLSVLPTTDELERAVREVWASTFKREVLAYRAQFGLPFPCMAVILQPMKPITAQERSGVAFSRSPVPTMPGVLIQASFGAGRAVVEGRGGDMFAVQGEQVNTIPMPPPNITVSGAKGEVAAPTPPGVALTPQEARQLAAHVLKMSLLWGKPVNVEFVWYGRDREPLFVQIRPTTDAG